MRVYKLFDSRWGTEALLRRRLKASILDDLNDPFEGRCVRFKSKLERIAWEKALKSFSLKHGLVCFSKGWSNPVLWSHYADQHRGMALGFDIANHVPISEVAYQDTLLDFNDIWAARKDDQWRAVQQIFTTKFKHWEYEEEVRSFCDLSEKDTVSGHYFLDYGADLKLKEVVFGAKFNGDALWVRKCVSDIEDVRFTTARLAFQTFSITNQSDRRRQF